MLSGETCLAGRFVPIQLCSIAYDAETVQSVGIDECCEVLQGLPFHTRLYQTEIVDAVRTFYPALDVEMRPLPEEQRTSEEGPLWNDYNSPTLAGAAVYHGLYCCRLHQRRVILHAIICDNVLLAQRLDIHLCSVTEESIHFGAVRPLRVES